MSRGEGPARVFYDGDCGLCHGVVRVLLAADRRGDRFRFAPLAGPTFAASTSPEDRARLPDSVVVTTPDGRLLTRSAAVLYAAERLGAPWTLLALPLRLLPRAVADALYDVVARARRLLPRRHHACPLVPPALRGRFDE